jgi:hypothetical protein
MDNFILTGMLLVIATIVGSAFYGFAILFGMAWGL